MLDVATSVHCIPNFKAVFKSCNDFMTCKGALYLDFVRILLKFLKQKHWNFICRNVYSLVFESSTHVLFEVCLYSFYNPSLHFFCFSCSQSTRTKCYKGIRDWKASFEKLVLVLEGQEDGGNSFGTMGKKKGKKMVIFLFFLLHDDDNVFCFYPIIVVEIFKNITFCALGKGLCRCFWHTIS